MTPKVYSLVEVKRHTEKLGQQCKHLTMKESVSKRKTEFGTKVQRQRKRQNLSRRHVAKDEEDHGS